MLSVFDRNYNGRTIRIRQDKYVCLTDMAAASGKLFADWARLKSTMTYLEVLSESMGIPIDDLVTTSDSTAPNEQRGTWAHPRIAIKFAAWCSPQFEVQVTIWIDELLTTGTVTLAAPPQPVRQLAPQRDLIDYVNAMEIMGIQRDPLLVSLVSQRMAEQLGGAATQSTAPLQIIVTVRAQELGYSTKEIGNGSALGAFVKKQGCKPAGKTKHGKYDVNVYDLTPQLDKAIASYFS